MRSSLDSSCAQRLTASEGKRPLIVGLRLDFIGEVFKIGSPEVERWPMGWVTIQPELFLLCHFCGFEGNCY